jgi:signal transduction histidine kinase
VNYINKIVQDLQDFAKPVRPTLRKTDLEDICRELLKKNSVPQNVKAVCQIDEDAKYLKSDPEILRRIVGNLLSNAIQAMPDGGKLSIASRKEKDNIIVAVEDTGVGIPKAVQLKLFTPLFTTKSKGQGFGLPVVKRMTEALGGTVSFESEVGKGTIFKIQLPRRAPEQ